MKADDRFMVSLTAIVLVIAVGTMAQKSEFIMAAFGSVDEFEAVEDAFTVRAGRTQALDVLSNDLNVQDGDENSVLIVQQPVCGTARRAGGQVEYLNSDACSGQMIFTYCVIQGDSCPSAQVVLNVTLPEAFDGRDAVADAGTSAFPTLRAPSLASPDSNVGIAPAQATAALRNRDLQPVQIGSPSQEVGVGLGAQQSAAISVGGLGSGFGSAPSLETSRPNLGVSTASVRPSSPQLGSVSRGFGSTPARPTQQTEIAALPQIPVIERPRQVASNPTTGVAPGLPQQPQVADASPSDAGIVNRVSTGRINLRSVTSMFRPGGNAVASESPTFTAQASARPQVNLSPGLQDAGVVTERAAQIILPVATDNAVARAGSTPSSPSMPSEQNISDLSLGTPSLGGGFTRSDVETAALSPAEPSLPIVDVTPEANAVVECGINVVASAKLGEMLAMTLSSDCRPNALVSVSYSGLQFDSVTDTAGLLQVDLPAFDEDTTITVRYSDGAEASTDITVRGIERVARVGIAWNGGINLDLHAFEYSALENSDGHVWEGNIRSYRDSRRNGGGYLTQLGLPGARQIEVYTLPVSRRTQDGLVDTQVRIGDGSRDCAQRIEVMSIYNNQDLISDQRSVSLEIAGCDANGQSMSFSSAVRDITVAQR